MGNLDAKAQFDMKISQIKAATTATANGASFDVSDVFGQAAKVDIGVWTDGTHTITLEESDDDIAWSTVVAGDLDGTLPVIVDGTTDNTEVVVGYKGSKKFLRLVTTVATATIGAVYGLYILKGFGKKIPLN